MKYTTVAQEEGVDYRRIATILTNLGYPMGHSTVRNIIVRIMKAIAEAYVVQYDIYLNNKQLTALAMNPDFQALVSQLLQMIEAQRMDLPQA